MKFKEGIKEKNIIIKCGADTFLPFALVFGLFVILFGTASSGGGFQGGVLVAAVVLLTYLGYGGKALHKTFSEHFLHSSETIAEIIYVLVALLGVVAGTVFCFNYVFPGRFLETSVLMNDAVGYHVMAGISGLLLLMLGCLEEGEEAEEETDGAETEDNSAKEGTK